MIETLLGGFLGGVLRLAPELFKTVDRRNERSHELALQNVQLEFQKLAGAQKMAELGAQADASWSTGAIDALRESIRGQSEKTGVRWADALSGSVRPVITYSFFGLYASLKWAAWQATGNVQAVWTDGDSALWAGIVNFWFLSRAFEKRPQ